MEILAIIVQSLGYVVALVGGVWFLVVAFRKSLAWGLLSFFVPPVGLVFLARHWKSTAKPFYLWLLGVILVLLGWGMSFIGTVSPQAEAAGEDSIRLFHYLLVSAVVFGLGVMVVITRRNAIAVLMGIELMLNGAGLNFVAFSRFSAPDAIEGQVVTLFVIVIAAAEAALALAIVLNIFNNLNTIQVDEARTLKG